MSSPSKLYSCVDARAILESPHNTSTAKHHWSFGKDTRFKPHKYHCDTFYHIPGIKDNTNRTTGLGYGRKTHLEYDQHPHQITPCPTTYNIASFADTNKLHQKGFTPNQSREQIAPMSYIQLDPMKVPGPGRYEEHRVNESPRWSLRKRVSEDIFPQTTVKIVPGPAAYTNQQAIEFHKQGHFHLSNHTSSKSKTFNPPRSKRFNKSTTNVPGPGVYYPQNDLSNQGKYVMSKNISAGQRKFMEGRRLSFIDITARRSYTPGPGSYINPSEFGHYHIKKEFKAASRMLGERMKNASSNTDRTKITQKVEA